MEARAQEVELLREDDGKPVTFLWNKLTTFVTGESMADAAILRKGARVEVNLHTPLFGKPFVTKVTLLPAIHPPEARAARRRRLSPR